MSDDNDVRIGTDDLRAWLTDPAFERETGDPSWPHGPEIELWGGGRHLDMGALRLKRYGDGDVSLRFGQDTAMTVRAEDAWVLAAFLLGFYYGRKEEETG